MPAPSRVSYLFQATLAVANLQSRLFQGRIAQALRLPANFQQNQFQRCRITCFQDVQERSCSSKVERYLSHIYANS